MMAMRLLTQQRCTLFQQIIYKKGIIRLTFLKLIGVKLNDAGGEIKISHDRLLRQSSTVAQSIQATFAGGETAEIAGSYVEFAERLPLPKYAKLPKEKLTNSQRREGFETGNADKIFESTFREQINKHS